MAIAAESFVGPGKLNPEWWPDGNFDSLLADAMDEANALAGPPADSSLEAFVFERMYADLAARRMRDPTSTRTDGEQDTWSAEQVDYWGRQHRRWQRICGARLRLEGSTSKAIGTQA